MVGRYARKSCSKQEVVVVLIASAQATLLWQPRARSGFGRSLLRRVRVSVARERRKSRRSKADHIRVQRPHTPPRPRDRSIAEQSSSNNTHTRARSPRPLHNFSRSGGALGSAWRGRGCAAPDDHFRSPASDMSAENVTYRKLEHRHTRAHTAMRDAATKKVKVT